jgi:putative intracellular protease/amidase
MKKFVCPLLFAFLSLCAFLAHAGEASGQIAPYADRFGRSRPVVAVVGENSGTVLSDFVIPYGVLAQSGVAEVLSVSTGPGPMKLTPLSVQADRSIEEFDQRFPDGADYVIVPAVEKNEDPRLLAWVAAQAKKGATMISICNGSLVLANAGLTHGHSATGHWSTHQMRVKKYPETRWVKNVRFVADGKIVTSAGITAAMPVSIALVTAIAGKEQADALAQRLGVADWSTRHDSDAFGFTMMDGVTAARNKALHASEQVGVRVAPGVDEIGLAWQVEAYAATLRGQIVSLADTAGPVKTRGGLTLLPDRVGGIGKLDRLLPPLEATPPGKVLDLALKDIGTRYGERTLRLVLLEIEYPEPK